MTKLTILNTGETSELQEGESLEHVCEEAGVPFACSEGVCGTCVVKLVEGGENLTDPTDAEKDFFGEEGVKKERMACQCSIRKGCGKGSVTIKF